jgi:hypothetical protein
VITQVWPPLPGCYLRSGRIMWQACCLGHEPAESLHSFDREHLVDTLVLAGWKLPAIAGLTRQTLYTTGRIALQARRLRYARDAETVTAAVTALQAQFESGAA